MGMIGTLKDLIKLGLYDQIITAGNILAGTVATWADLPEPAADYQSKLYVVTQGSGGWLAALGVYKYPAGLYTPNPSNVWQITPFNIKVSEDAMTLVNITDWAGYIASAIDITAGDRLIFNGIEYTNTTGTQTSTDPSSDSTNWKSTTDYLDLTTGLANPSHNEGRLFYDNDNKALGFYNDETESTAQIPYESWFRGRNKTTVSIPNASAVYQGPVDSGIPTVLLAKADSPLTSDTFIGLMTHTIADSTNGIVVTRGTLRGYDTQTPGWSSGDILWLSATTAGALTNVRPDIPNRAIRVGVVGIVDTTNGTIDVNLGSPLTQSTAEIVFENDGVNTHVDSLDEFLNHIGSAFAGDGFDLTEPGTPDGTLSISGGTSVLRKSDTPTHGTPLKSFSVAALTNDNPAADDQYFYYVDYNGGSPIITKTTDPTAMNGLSQVPIWMVTKVGAATLHTVDLREYSVDSAYRTAEASFYTDGLKRVPASSILAESGTDLTIIVSSGKYYIANLPVTHAAFDTDIADTFTYIHRAGVASPTPSQWTRVTAQTVIDNTQYDLNGTLTTVANNKFTSHWVFVVLNNPAELFVLYGQQEHADLSSAQAEQLPANLPPELTAYSTGLFIGKIIIEKSATTFADIQSPFTTSLTSSVPVAHNALSELQGGTSGEYYHLTSDESVRHSNIYNIVNGAFAETFNALVESNGTVITMTLEQSGGGDLTMQFSTGNVTLDCTPAQTKELTAGTVAVPQENYIYIPISTKQVTKSLTQWPTEEHIKIGFFFCQTAAETLADGGSLINQNWNDHCSDPNGMGHNSHIGRWIRNQPAKYFSGLDPAGVDDYTTSAAGSVTVHVTNGIVSQLHPHTVTAKDTSGTDDIHVINAHATDGGAYFTTQNLYDITVDSQGGSLTNKYFNIVLGSAANKSGEYDPLFAIIPSGSYNNLSDAESDVNGYDTLDLPRQFTLDSGTGFLISRQTYRKVGGTWVHQSTVNLRGTLPTSVSGGVPAGSPITNFNDATFTIFNNVDATKIIDFDLSGITTENTRTLTIPDASGTLLLDGNIGSTIQAYDAGLQSISTLTTLADRMIYATASDTYAVTPLTSFARTLLDDADAATMRATLGVGVGDVVGPTSSTDNAIARFDATTGKLIQNSNVSISDVVENEVTLASSSETSLILSSGGGGSISAFEYRGTSYNFGAVDDSGQAIWFSTDGTRMYMAGSQHDSIYEFTLSTAWDVSSATYTTNNIDFPTVTGDSNPRGIAFNPSGTKLFVVGDTDNRVHQWTLLSPWALSTATYDSKVLDVSSQSTDSEDLAISSDGTRVYIIDMASSTLYSYTLSTPWDLSTGSYDSKSFALATESWRGMWMDEDGINFYVVNDSDLILQYKATTPYDITTLVDTGKILDTDNETTSPKGLYIGNNGTFLAVACSTPDIVFQYSLGIPKIKLDRDNIASIDAKLFNFRSKDGNTILATLDEVNGLVINVPATIDNDNLTVNGNIYSSTYQGVSGTGNITIGNATGGGTVSIVSTTAIGIEVNSNGSITIDSTVGDNATNIKTAGGSLGLNSGTDGGNITIGNAANTNVLNLNSSNNVNITASALDITAPTDFNDNNVSSTEYDNGTKSANFTIDWSTHSNNQKVTVSASCSVTSFTAPPNPCHLTLRFINSGTPTITLSAALNIDWGDAGAPTFDTATGKVNIIFLYFAGGSKYYGSYITGATT